MATPFMNIELPVPVGQLNPTPGPTWANRLNEALSTLDSHTHETGHGAPVKVKATGSLVARLLEDVAADVRDTAERTALATQNANTTRTLMRDLTDPNATLTLADFATATGAAVSYDVTKETAKVAWSSATNGQYSGIKIVGPWNLSTSNIFAVDVGFDKNETLTRIRVDFNFDAGSTWTNYATMSTIASGRRKLRRQTFSFLKTDLTVTGTANWAAVQRIEVRLYSTDGTETFARTMYIYGVWSHVVARPKIVLSFDDHWDTDYTEAYPRLTAAGMKASFGSNGGTVGGTNKVTLAQLTTMYRAGWDIINHTWDHTAIAQALGITASGTTATATCANVNDAHGLVAGQSVTIAGADEADYNGTFTVATTPNTYTFTYTMGGSPASPARGWPGFRRPPGTIREKVQKQRDWMIANGFTRSLGHFIYPQGYFDDASITILQDMGFETGRMTEAGPSDYILPLHSGLVDSFHIPVIELNNTQTAVAVLTQVDAAIAKGAALHIYGHRLVTSPSIATEFSLTEFQTLVDGLKTRKDAGSIDVVTFAEWFNGL